MANQMAAERQHRVDDRDLKRLLDELTRPQSEAETPGKQTLAEQLDQLAVILRHRTARVATHGRARMSPSHPGQRGLVGEMLTAAPKLDFSDCQALALRDVLSKLRNNRALHEGTLAAADPRVAQRVAPRLQHGDATAAGQAMWGAANQRAVTLFRRATATGIGALETRPVAEAIGRIGTGQPLPDDLRRKLEAALGVSLEGVRLHIGSVARAAADAVNAEAFTVGEDIFLPTYEPTSSRWQETLAHEVMHTVQWRQGRIGAGGGVSRPDDPLEREAEHAAKSIVARAFHGATFRPMALRGAKPSDVPAPMFGAFGSVPTTAMAPRAPGVQMVMRQANGSQTASRPVPQWRSDIPIGFVDHNGGADVWTEPPEKRGQLIRKLKPTTRVFVSGTHPKVKDWVQVTEIPAAGQVEGISLAQGYVERSRVTTRFPDPNAELYQIVGGDTVDSVVARKYSKLVRPGRDLRFYENVLLRVNREEKRKGIPAKTHAQDAYGQRSSGIQLVDGERIWLVSPHYAEHYAEIVGTGKSKAKEAAWYQNPVFNLVRSSLWVPQHVVEDVAGEYGEYITKNLKVIAPAMAGILLAVGAAVLVKGVVGMIIMLGLTAMGITATGAAIAAASDHGENWLLLAWNAGADSDQLDEASREFMRMWVTLLLAYLAARGTAASASMAGKYFNTLPKSPGPGRNPPTHPSGGSTIDLQKNPDGSYTYGREAAAEPTAGASAAESPAAPATAGAPARPGQHPPTAGGGRLQDPDDVFSLGIPAMAGGAPHEPGDPIPKDKSLVTTGERWIGYGERCIGYDQRSQQLILSGEATLPASEVSIYRPATAEKRSENLRVISIKAGRGTFVGEGGRKVTLGLQEVAFVRTSVAGRNLHKPRSFKELEGVSPPDFGPTWDANGQQTTLPAQRSLPEVIPWNVDPLKHTAELEDSLTYVRDYAEQNLPANYKRVFLQFLQLRYDQPIQSVTVRDSLIDASDQRVMVKWILKDVQSGLKKNKYVGPYLPYAQKLEKDATNMLAKSFTQADYGSLIELYLASLEGGLTHKGSPLKVPLTGRFSDQRPPSNYVEGYFDIDEYIDGAVVHVTHRGLVNKPTVIDAGQVFKRRDFTVEHDIRHDAAEGPYPEVPKDPRVMDEGVGASSSGAFASELTLWVRQIHFKQALVKAFDVKKGALKNDTASHIKVIYLVLSHEMAGSRLPERMLIDIERDEVVDFCVRIFRENKAKITVTEQEVKAALSKFKEFATKYCNGLRGRGASQREEAQFARELEQYVDGDDDISLFLHNVVANIKVHTNTNYPTVRDCHLLLHDEQFKRRALVAGWGALSVQDLIRSYDRLESFVDQRYGNRPVQKIDPALNLSPQSAAHEPTSPENFRPNTSVTTLEREWTPMGKWAKDLSPKQLISELLQRTNRDYSSWFTEKTIEPYLSKIFEVAKSLKPTSDPSPIDPSPIVKVITELTGNIYFLSVTDPQFYLILRDEYKRFDEDTALERMRVWHLFRSLRNRLNQADEPAKDKPAKDKPKEKSTDKAPKPAPTMLEELRQWTSRPEATEIGNIEQGMEAWWRTAIWANLLSPDELATKLYPLIQSKPKWMAGTSVSSYFENFVENIRNRPDVLKDMQANTFGAIMTDAESAKFALGYEYGKFESARVQNVLDRMVGWHLFRTLRERLNDDRRDATLAALQG